jgi:hypothetical protein
LCPNRHLVATHLSQTWHSVLILTPDTMNDGVTSSGALLNRTRFLVRPAFDRQLGVDTYAILDPQTAAMVGFGFERKPGATSALIRKAFGRNLLMTAVQVFEPDGQTPVFSLQELPSWWSPRLAVLGPDGRPVCFFASVFATVGGGFQVRDTRRKPLGEILCESEEGEYAFRSGCGRRIGTIQELTPAENMGADHGLTEYRIDVADAGELGDVASFGLLAATLALDIIYGDRMGGDETRRLNPVNPQPPVTSAVAGCRRCWFWSPRPRRAWRHSLFGSGRPALPVLCSLSPAV